MRVTKVGALSEYIVLGTPLLLTNLLNANLIDSIVKSWMSSIYRARIHSHVNRQI